MGCLLGIVASAAAVGGAWIANHVGAPGWLIAAVFVGAIVAFAVPAVVFGHHGFGGGGPTDLMMYLAVTGIVAALVVPRLVRTVACRRVNDHVEWVWLAENDFHAARGYYAADMDSLVAFAGESRPFEFHSDVSLAITGAAADTFVAVGEHAKCTIDGEVMQQTINQAWTPVEN